MFSSLFFLREGNYLDLIEFAAYRAEPSHTGAGPFVYWPCIELPQSLDRHEQR